MPGEPCLNGGACFDGDDEFFCACPTGYEGPTCAVDTNECAVQPCLHSGTCSESSTDAGVEVGSFQCACLVGWSGATCAESQLAAVSEYYGLAMSTASDCASVEAGVTAIQDMACIGGAEWSNYCPQGCSANECDSQPCANGGLCFDGEGEYLCICTEDYRGENCEVDAFVCAPGSYLTPAPRSAHCVRQDRLTQTTTRPLHARHAVLAKARMRVPLSVLLARLVHTARTVWTTARHVRLIG